VDGKGHRGALDDRVFREHAQVITVKGDVQDADRYGLAFDLFDLAGNPLRQRHAAALDANQADIFQALVAFEDFMGDPGQGPVDCSAVHQDCFVCHGCSLLDCHESLESDGKKIAICRCKTGGCKNRIPKAWMWTPGCDGRTVVNL